MNNITESYNMNTYEISIYNALGFPKAESNDFTIKDLIEQVRKDFNNSDKELPQTDKEILISILSFIRNGVNNTI
jgi:hypothetical protein